MSLRLITPLLLLACAESHPAGLDIHRAARASCELAERCPVFSEPLGFDACVSLRECMLSHPCDERALRAALAYFQCTARVDTCPRFSTHAVPGCEAEHEELRRLYEERLAAGMATSCFPAPHVPGVADVCSSLRGDAGVLPDVP